MTAHLDLAGPGSGQGRGPQDRRSDRPERAGASDRRPHRQSAQSGFLHRRAEFHPGALARIDRRQAPHSSWPRKIDGPDENRMYLAVTDKFPTISTVRVKERHRPGGYAAQQLAEGIRIASLVTILRGCWSWPAHRGGRAHHCTTPPCSRCRRGHGADRAGLMCWNMACWDHHRNHRSVRRIARGGSDRRPAADTPFVFDASAVLGRWWAERGNSVVRASGRNYGAECPAGRANSGTVDRQSTLTLRSTA